MSTTRRGFLGALLGAGAACVAVGRASAEKVQAVPRLAHERDERETIVPLGAGGITIGEFRDVRIIDDQFGICCLGTVWMLPDGGLRVIETTREIDV